MVGVSLELPKDGPSIAKVGEESNHEHQSSPLEVWPRNSMERISSPIAPFEAQSYFVK